MFSKTYPILRPSFEVPPGRVLAEGPLAADAEDESNYLTISSELTQAAGLLPGQPLRLFQYQNGWFLTPGSAVKYSKTRVQPQGTVKLSNYKLTGSADVDYVVKAVDGGLIIQSKSGVALRPRAPAPQEAGAFGWSWVRKGSGANAQQKRYEFLELYGSTLKLCGLQEKDLISVELYDNMTAVFKDPSGTRQCLVKKAPHQLGFRLGESCFEGLNASDKVVVVYGTHAIYLVPSTDYLSQFGLTLSAELRSHARAPLSKKFKVRPPADLTQEQLAGTSFYVLPQSGDLEISGDWLGFYGFTPGQRYRVSRHPTMKTRLLLTQDSSGDFAIQVGQNDLESSLKVPEELWSQLPGAYARVMPAEDGLHVYAGNPRGIYG